MNDSMKELKCLPFLYAVLLLRFLLTAYCRTSSTANFSCVLILYVTKMLIYGGYSVLILYNFRYYLIDLQ